MRTLPPLGASGLTKSRWVKSGGYFGSPISESAWWWTGASSAWAGTETRNANRAAAARRNNVMVAKTAPYRLEKNLPKRGPDAAQRDRRSRRLRPRKLAWQAP